MHMPGLRFLRNVALFSLAGICAALLVYVLVTPGMVRSLSQGAPNVKLILRQVLTNGVPVVLAVNYSGFFLYAWSNRQHARRSDPGWFIALDMVIRTCSFVGGHAWIYVLSADWFGSFGGSRTTALSVVAPTLAHAGQFQNLSGVYLYASLVSALPLYISASRRSKILGPTVLKFDPVLGPFGFALFCFGIFVVSLTSLMFGLMWVQDKIF